MINPCNDCPYLITYPADKHGNSTACPECDYYRLLQKEKAEEFWKAIKTAYSEIKGE